MGRPDVCWPQPCSGVPCHTSRDADTDHQHTLFWHTRGRYSGNSKVLVVSAVPSCFLSAGNSATPDVTKAFLNVSVSSCNLKIRKSVLQRQKKEPTIVFLNAPVTVLPCVRQNHGFFDPSPARPLPPPSPGLPSRSFN